MRLRYSVAALAIGISSLAQAAIDPQYQYLSALPAPQDTLVLPLLWLGLILNYHGLFASLGVKYLA